MNETINKQIHLAMTCKAGVIYGGVYFDVEYDHQPAEPDNGLREEFTIESITHKGTDFEGLLTPDQLTDIEQLIIEEGANHEF